MEQENRISRTFRLEKDLADGLKLEATLREINGVEPASQQDIVEAALRSWFETEALSGTVSASNRKKSA